MTQSGDEKLSCSEIDDQHKQNTEQAAKLLESDNNVQKGNVIKGVVFAPLLAAALMDMSNEEQIRARALIDRDQRLDMLARDKGCPQP